MLCGVLERENRDVSGPQVRPLVELRSEPRSVVGFCCADGPLPVEERPQGEFSSSGYQHCPVWRAECARREKGDPVLIAEDAMYGGVA